MPAPGGSPRIPGLSTAGCVQPRHGGSRAHTNRPELVAVHGTLCGWGLQGVELLFPGRATLPCPSRTGPTCGPSAAARAVMPRSSTPSPPPRWSSRRRKPLRLAIGRALGVGRKECPRRLSPSTAARSGRRRIGPVATGGGEPSCALTVSFGSLLVGDDGRGLGADRRTCLARHAQPLAWRGRMVL